MPLAPHPEFDRVLKTLESVPAIAWKGECYRAAEERWATTVELFSGKGAQRIGGRWNAPGTATVYASLDPEVALKEWLAQAKRAGIPVRSRLPVAVSWGEVDLQRLVDLTSSLTLRRLAPRKALLAVEWGLENDAGRESLPQAVGRAALKLGCEALLVPSAVTRAANLVLFPQALRPGSRVVPHGLRRR